MSLFLDPLLTTFFFFFYLLNIDRRVWSNVVWVFELAIGTCWLSAWVYTHLPDEGEN